MSKRIQFLLVCACLLAACQPVSPAIPTAPTLIMTPTLESPKTPEANLEVSPTPTETPVEVAMEDDPTAIPSRPEINLKGDFPIVESFESLPQLTEQLLRELPQYPGEVVPVRIYQLADLVKNPQPNIDPHPVFFIAQLVNNVDGTRDIQWCAIDTYKTTERAAFEGWAKPLTLGEPLIPFPDMAERAFKHNSVERRFLSYIKKIGLLKSDGKTPAIKMALDLWQKTGILPERLKNTPVLCYFKP